jgi:heparin binding hemagglutinin HbhA
VRAYQSRRAVSTTKSEQKYATPVYAAAGLGDLAIEQLRRLPALAEELRVKAVRLREQAPVTAAAGKIEVDKIRTVVFHNAQKAAEAAVGVYGDLVARGTKVIDRDADVEPVASVDVVEPTSVAKPAEPKPARRPKTTK